MINRSKPANDSSQHHHQIKDGSSGELILSGEICVEVENVTFRLSSHGDSALVSLNGLGDTYRVFRKIRDLFVSSGMQHSSFENTLQRLGITLYLQNYRFGVMGPKANSMLKRFLGFVIFSR